ncbi:MAG: YidC/Oxa1 family membrane protein insertase [Candidatus Limivivens sp.]|nr:YidC/Oxa1 family membrane protein insertase [Candidatus Limivivens sp.]
MLLTKSNTFIIGPVATLLGIIMNAIFNFLGVFGIQNIGLCIILFTIIIYALMVPMTIKQQKFSKLSAQMNPEIQKIQKKYKGKQDQVSMMKMNEETKAVYAKYGVSPTGSCLPLLIQFPILFALYRVIWNVPAYVDGVKNSMMGLVNQILAVDGAQELLSEFATKNQVNFEKLGFNAESIVDTLYKLKPADWTSLAEKFPTLTDSISGTQETLDHMNYFLGLNISDAPLNVLTSAFSEGKWLLVIGALMIPVLAGVTQWLNTKLMPQAETQSGDSDNTMANSMKMMNNVMPIMSMVFCFTLPAGLGIYWIASAVVRSIVQVITNKKMDNMDIDALIAKNLEKENKKREKQGLPPQKVSNQAKARMTVKETENPSKKQTSEEERQKKIQDSTEYYQKHSDAKPGSIAAKARMVQQYNERNKK